MMGAAILKRHQFVRSLWALYRLVVSYIMWGSQAQPLCKSVISLSRTAEIRKISRLSIKVKVVRLI